MGEKCTKVILEIDRIILQLSRPLLLQYCYTIFNLVVDMNKVFNDKVQASFGFFFQQIDKLLHCKSMTTQGENLGDLMIFQSLRCSPFNAKKIGNWKKSPRLLKLCLHFIIKVLWNMSTCYVCIVRYYEAILFDLFTVQAFIIQLTIKAQS